jgi:hypothetical protein
MGEDHFQEFHRKSKRLAQEFSIMSDDHGGMRAGWNPIRFMAIDHPEGHYEQI